MSPYMGMLSKRQFLNTLRPRTGPFHQFSHIHRWERQGPKAKDKHSMLKIKGRDAEDLTDPWSDDNGDLQGHRPGRGYDQRLVGEDPERKDSTAVASAIERRKELPGPPAR